MRRAARALIIASQILSKRGAVVYSVAVGIPALAFLVYLSLPAHGPLLTQDGPGYMYFEMHRSVGYPLFLAGVKAVFGDLRMVAELQLLIYCAATVALGLSIYFASGSLVLMTLLELGVLLYPGPAQMSQQILSDSLSASLIMLWAAALISVVDRKRTSSVVALSATTAAALSVRSGNLALVPAGFLAILAFGNLLSMPRLAQIAIFAAGVAGGFGITPAVHTAIYGDAHTPSSLAIAVFQKVMFIPPSRVSTGTACDQDLIDPLLAPVNSYLQTAPTVVRSVLELRYSAYLRYSVILPSLTKKLGGVSSGKIDDSIMCYTVARFSEAPGAVTVRIITEYWKLLTNWTYITQQERAAFYDFVAKHPPVIPTRVEKPAEETGLRRRAIAELGGIAGIADTEAFIKDGMLGASDFEAPPARPRSMALALAAFQVVAAVISTIGIVAVGLAVCGFREADRNWAIIGVLGVAAQGIMIVTAIAEIALPRYVYPVWPLLCTVMALAAFALFTKNLGFFQIGGVRFSRTSERVPAPGHLHGIEKPATIMTERLSHPEFRG
jgi:hypothetical protein